MAGTRLARVRPQGLNGRDLNGMGERSKCKTRLRREKNYVVRVWLARARLAGREAARARHGRAG